MLVIANVNVYNNNFRYHCPNNNHSNNNSAAEEERRQWMPIKFVAISVERFPFLDVFPITWTHLSEIKTECEQIRWKSD